MRAGLEALAIRGITAGIDCSAGGRSDRALHDREYRGPVLNSVR
jgi:hypothetical protein